MGAFNTSLNDAHGERDSHDCSLVVRGDEVKLHTRVALERTGCCTVLAMVDEDGKDLPLVA